MKTITVKICPTFQAERDKEFLEANGIRAAVVPHTKSPTAYVGDTQVSEIVVREDELQKAKELLDLE